jgi:tetratricopeptide (TPR) repeat protein
VGGLAALNVWTTAEADFFSGGAGHLQGPRAVRVLMALAFYFEHFVWPVGLSSYYPAPPMVAWTDAATIRAAITVLVGCGILGWASWKSRACGLATVWFFAGLFDTLPFFPARNVLAADRYMYLPIIGLLWFTATLGHAGHRRLLRRSPAVSHAALTVGALALVPLLVGICWRVAAGYTTAQAQALRIAELFPEEPRVWERLGWTYHRAGDYEVAIELARRELGHPEPDVRSGAYQLIGLSEIQRGNAEGGLRFLHEAAEIDPDSGLACFRLAQGYEELGRHAEALPYYEKAVEVAPLDNPTIRRLARVYRRLDRIDEARAAYGKALANNRFDVEAALGLAELAIESGEESALLEAENFLSELSADVPSEPRVRTDLGLVHFLRQEGDESLKLAAAAFIALTDGRYATASERVERLCAAGDDPAGERRGASAEGRGWLLTQLERFDQERPGEAWTFGLTARLLIADQQLEAAGAAIALFESLCGEPQCAAYAGELRGKLAGS